MANISHLGVLSFSTHQTELGQSSTHIYRVYVVIKLEERDTNTIFFLKGLNMYVLMYCYVCTNQFNDRNRSLHSILQRVEFRR